MQTYVTAAGYSHWHIVSPETPFNTADDSVKSVCGETFPPPSADPTSRRMRAVPDGQPLCMHCSWRIASGVELGANVLDPEAFKAGAAFERRLLAARLRALLELHASVGLEREVYDLANELEQREGT